jgi:hypothetical protein
MQYGPLKRWKTCTSLHGATTQQTAIFKRLGPFIAEHYSFKDYRWFSDDRGPIKSISKKFCIDFVYLDQVPLKFIAYYNNKSGNFKSQVIKVKTVRHIYVTL